MGHPLFVNDHAEHNRVGHLVALMHHQTDALRPGDQFLSIDPGMRRHLVSRGLPHALEHGINLTA